MLSTNGDTYLGGDDFDQLIMQHFMTQLHWTPEFLQQHKELSQTIRLTAEEAKNN